MTGRKGRVRATDGGCGNRKSTAHWTRVGVLRTDIAGMLYFEEISRCQFGECT